MCVQHKEVFQKWAGLAPFENTFIPSLHSRFVHTGTQAAVSEEERKTKPSLPLCHRSSCISVHAASIFLLYLRVHGDRAKGYNMFYPRPRFSPIVPTSKPEMLSRVLYQIIPVIHDGSFWAESYPSAIWF